MVNLNVSTVRREGPLEYLDRGMYKGSRVEDIIRKNPSYIMHAIKEWLYITPHQALVFEEVTGGGIIPEAYIKERVPPSRGEYSTSRDLYPNWDFDPEMAPPWWKEFKEEAHKVSPEEVPELYERYSRKELKKIIQEFYNV